MVYLLYGKDLTKLNYYLDKIKLENADGEILTVETPANQNFAASSLYSPPMLTDKRLVIFENLKNFSQIDFSKIHSNVNLVIIQRSEYKPKIPKADNLVLLEAKKTPLIFKFLDNLVFASESRNLSSLFEILKTEDPNFVFHQIISHFRRLIMAKNGKFDEKLANWQIEKYQRIVSQLSLEKLKVAYKLLLTTEIEVKTGQKELKDTLPILILKLTKTLKSS